MPHGIDSLKRRIYSHVLTIFRLINLIVSFYILGIYLDEVQGRQRIWFKRDNWSNENQITAV
mgnify:CR=1 FL=1